MGDSFGYTEINLLDIGFSVLRKWWFILILMIAAGSVSYYMTVNYITPQYKATATLFIGKDAQGFGEINLSDLSLDSKLVSDYRELIKTRLVTDQVIDELALVASQGSLTGKLSISVVGESRFMYVTFIDTVPARAEIVVNTLADVLANEAERIVGVKNVQIVDYALRPTRPISPNIASNVMLAVIGGAALAIGLILLGILLDNTITNEENIELSFETPVLGVIPTFKGEVRSK